LDKPDQEYRAYVGYTKDGKDYLGLPKGDSIQIWVPLVFWDSGRADIATSDAGFLPKDPDTSKATAITNPFNFYYKNTSLVGGGSTARYVVPAVSSTDNGVVMFYHSLDKAVNPAADAPAQLIEFTIRDLAVMTAINKINPIPDTQIKTLINYDVSYVDHLLLPVAMEATDVPVPNTSPQVKDAYAWIGSDQAFAPDSPLETAIKKFTTDGPDNGLGKYFEVDGKDLGWPTYYNPSYSTVDPSSGLKIPGGANILLDSPLANKRSSYNNNRWMLSSGGDKPVEVGLNGTFHTGPNRAVINGATEKQLESLRPGMSVIVDTKTVGTIDSVDVPSKTVKLTLSSTLTDGTSYSFNFFNSPTDPYATKITNLWYSWAKYYQDLPQFKNYKTQTLSANVSTDTDNNKNDYRILTFTNPPPVPLAVGMQVRPTTGIPPLITIIKIVTPVSGPTQYYLSRPVPGVTGPTTMQLQFLAPQPIAYAAQTNNIRINFDKQPAEKPFAAAFAATAYELMSVYSTATIRDAQLPPAMGVVENVIGGNVGFLPSAKPIDYVNITADVRDLGKSALRGVPNFADPAYPESKWYPDPAKPTGDEPWNVFNLDPFVWFVHKKLGLSGYGFSFDDDTADVNADGSNDLYAAVGGPDGLPNKDEWKPSAPWGPKSSDATISDTVPGYVGKTVITLANKTVYNQLKADDAANGVVGAYVTGKGITPGTNLLATANINQNQFVLSKPATPTNTPVRVDFSANPPK
jgi:hypothetical protein